MSFSMEQITSLAKRRGFIFPGSEIYGGLANSWDYGPLGTELKLNIKNYWWKSFVSSREDIVGLDSAILMNSKVWEGSGHLSNFSDPLVDCKSCFHRFRADHLIESKLNLAEKIPFTIKELKNKIIELNINCPNCGKQNFTDIRQFNLMFKTYQGVVEDKQSIIYLRPETAQGIFINFKNIITSSRQKIPFGIAQIGKAFRNEITPGNFIFRTREFEQMEIEYFCTPKKSKETFLMWKNTCAKWLEEIGILPQNFKLKDHKPEELSHYSQATTDIEFDFPFGTSELWGISHRGNYDLTQHQKFSDKDLTFFDSFTKEKYLPYCIEPSLGVDRLFLAILVNGYMQETVGQESRVVLKIIPALAPIKIAVLPLVKALKEQSRKIYSGLSKLYQCDFDDAGSVGRRYRRHDEIGTPYCVTFDFDSINDKKVTIRERDSMIQQRVSIEQLANYFKEILNM